MTMIMPTSVALTQKLQEYSLVNRGVLDTLGAAVPMVMLARNEEERREKMLDRTIVIGSAFVLAPLHAWLIMRGVARRHGIAPALMKLSYAELQSVEALKKGLHRLRSQKINVPGVPAIDEALRQTLVKAKTQMLVPDLIIECLIFASVGWITNFFTRTLTGKHQFTGEKSAVSEDALDELYENEAAFQQDERWRKLLTTGMALVAPIGLGWLLQKALLTPKKVLGILFQKIREKAHYFDYKDGIWMSMPTLGVVVCMQFLGQVMAARSERERRENLIREGMLNFVFFWGNALWMLLLSKMLFKPLKIPVETAIRKVIDRAPAGLKQKAGKIASAAYLTSFLLNTLTLSGVVVFNNRLTTRQVREDAAKLYAKKLTQLHQTGGAVKHKKPFEQYAQRGNRVFSLNEPAGHIAQGAPDNVPES